MHAKHILANAENEKISQLEFEPEISSIQTLLYQGPLTSRFLRAMYSVLLEHRAGLALLSTDGGHRVR
jgi:hypothetical protein